MARRISICFHCKLIKPASQYTRTLIEPVKCSECGKYTIEVGTRPAPKRSNKRAWKELYNIIMSSFDHATIRGVNCLLPQYKEQYLLLRKQIKKDQTI